MYNGAPELLRSTVLLAGLPAAIQDEVLPLFRLRAFGDGEPLIVRNGRDRDLHVLLDGAAEVWLRLGDRRILVGELGTGETAGEISFFDPSTPRSADVLARGPGLAAVLSQNAWQSLRVRCHPAVAHIERVMVHAGAWRFLRTSARIAGRLARVDGPIRPPPLAEHQRAGQGCLGLPDEPPFMADRLASCFRTAQVAEGTVLCREGDYADTLWVVANGEVAVEQRGQRGSHLVANLGAGAVIGAVGLVTRGRRTATCRAKTALRLLEMSAPRVEALLEERTPVASAFRRLLLLATGRQLVQADGALCRLTVEGRGAQTAPALENLLFRASADVTVAPGVSE